MLARAPSVNTSRGRSNKTASLARKGKSHREGGLPDMAV